MVPTPGSTVGLVDLQRYPTLPRNAGLTVGYAFHAHAGVDGCDSSTPGCLLYCWLLTFTLRYAHVHVPSYRVATPVCYCRLVLLLRYYTFHRLALCTLRSLRGLVATTLPL